MPFSIGQMLGGFKRKEGKKTPKVERRTKERVRGEGEQSSKRAGASGAPAERVSASAVKTVSHKQSDLAWSLIVRPHISEKSTLLGEGKYILKVSGRATKGELKRAVGDRYGVKVAGVRVLNMPSKQRRRGQTLGVRPGYKKAIVTLVKGQVIEQF